MDVHCHLVPGVDDGADSIDTSLQLLQEEYRQGVRRIICTPHFRREMFEPDDSLVQQQFLLLRQKAAELYPDLELALGREVHAHMDIVQTVRERACFTMAGTACVLTEFSGRHDAGYIRMLLQKIRAAGFRPVIAHAERYIPLVEDLDLVDELAGFGCLIQVNAGSILGEEGRELKKFTRELVKYDMIDFIGSDAHDMRERRVRLGECASWLKRKAGEDYVRRIMWENPSEKLLRHEK